MPIYTIEHKGKTYDIDAEDESALDEAVNDLEKEETPVIETKPVKIEQPSMASYMSAPNVPMANILQVQPEARRGYGQAMTKVGSVIGDVLDIPTQVVRKGIVQPLSDLSRKVDPINAYYKSIGRPEEAAINPLEKVIETGRQVLEGGLPEAVTAVGSVGSVPASKVALKAIKETPKTVKSVIRYAGDLVSPSAEKALTKAIRPGKWNKQFKEAAPVALTEIKKTLPNIDDIPEGEMLNQFIAGGKQAKTNVWAEIQDALNKSQSELTYGIKQITKEVPITKGLLLEKSGKPMPIQTKTINENIRILENGLNGDDIVSEMSKKIAPESRKLSPEVGNSILSAAKKYEGQQITIAEAEDRLQQLNAELTDYFKANPRSQWKKSNTSEAGALLTERAILKDALYKKIESLSGKDIAPLKKKYGALMNVMDEALGRVNVMERGAPVSLQQAINWVFGGAKLLKGDISGIFQIAGSEAIKSLNSTDRLLRTALRKTK